MKRTTSVLLTLAIVLATAPFLVADVKTQHKTTFQLAGMLGSIANRFAGDAAKDGLVSTTAVKGARQLRGSTQSGRIIDLSEEKVYDLDMKRKEYRVITFAELRKQWQDAQAKAQKDMKSSKDEAQPADPKQSGKQYEVSASVKETGQSKSIAGHTAREVVLTVTVHEKGKTLEAGGGLELTNTMWIAAKIAALDEIQAFDLKFMTAVYGDMLTGADPAQMSALLAQYPSFKEMSEKMAGELKKLQGTTLASTTVLETLQSPEDMAAAPATQDKPSGGLMGRLASKMGPKPKASEPRSKVFTSSDEVISIETTVTADDTAIPAGFKEKK